jgi:hypothetical protein
MRRDAVTLGPGAPNGRLGPRRRLRDGLALQSSKLVPKARADLQDLTCCWLLASDSDLPLLSDLTTGSLSLRLPVASESASG